MKTNREVLEDRLEDDEEQLKGLKSFVTELKAMTAKNGTDEAQFEEDLREAEHNIKFYDGEITRVKKEIADSPKDKPHRPGGTYEPKSPKPGISSIIFSSIGFVAGTLFGSILGSRSKK
ncbi:MAG TPA: hypothetical protein VGN90_03535 [Pyrinomonadaceae bacterium]|jgi:hypothetical protein|nr:hypothetical protein [Pyrinomonadaceae bacterium]